MEDMRAPLFLSCLFARINLNTGELRMANGGHDWPLWVKAAENQVEQVEMPGFVLGMFKEIEPEETRVTMRPGDCFVFFTDGVTEARNHDGKFYDDDRLEAIIKANATRSAEEIAHSIIESVAAFAGGRPLSDDLTLVVIKRKG